MAGASVDAPANLPRAGPAASIPLSFPLAVAVRFSRTAVPFAFAHRRLLSRHRRLGNLRCRKHPHSLRKPGGAARFSIDFQGVGHHNRRLRGRGLGPRVFPAATRGKTVKFSRFGWVPEWLKGTDCKSVGLAYVGSNPTPSTNFLKFTGALASVFG